MLYLSPDYRPSLHVLLDGIKTGANMTDTFQKAYGRPLEQVQKDLESYICGTRFNASLFDAKLAKEIEPEASESSQVEADLALADILANTRAKAAGARELYDRLAHDYPKDWQVEQGLVRLSLREGKRAEAVATLKRATEIDPEDREARLELGYAFVVADKHAEALEQFQLVKRITPEQAFGYFHAMAYAYYRLDRKAEAKAAAANCRKYAKTAEEIARVAQLVDALNYVGHLAVRSGHEADPTSPKLRRSGGLAVAEGTLRQIDCTDGKIRMHIGEGAVAMSFALLDPASVAIKDNATMDFTCGPQAPRRIRIEYEPVRDATQGTVGVVRGIEFPE